MQLSLSEVSQLRALDPLADPETDGRMFCFLISQAPLTLVLRCRDQEERRVKAFDDMIREARAAHAAAEAAKQLEGVSFSGDPIHGVNGPLRDENADPNKPRKPFVDVEDLD